MKRRGGGPEGGSWMDTYGDMVTLLLTFFVLLYSMSTLDAAKWDVFVRSIFPNGRPGEKSAEQIIINGKSTNESESAGAGNPSELTETIENAEDLYLQIVKALNDAGISGVEVSRGEDYTFVVFKDKAFFDGDSSVITKQGQETLTVFCDALQNSGEKLSQVNIMGHTAQGDPTRPNNPRNDRMLSVMRAAEVCLFIQGRGIIAPEKLISIGYGQFHPIADNESSEGRAKNRRVEILLIDEGAQIRDINEYFQEYYSGKNADKTIVTSGVPENIENGNNQEALQEVSPEGAEPQAENIEAGGEMATAEVQAQPEAVPEEVQVQPEEAVPAGRAPHSQEQARNKVPTVAGASREIPGEEEEEFFPYLVRELSRGLGLGHSR